MKKKDVHVDKVQLGVRIPPAMKAALEKVADQERRSLNGQVEIIFAEWLAARGKRK